MLIALYLELQSPSQIVHVVMDLKAHSSIVHLSHRDRSIHTERECLAVLLLLSFAVLKKMFSFLHG